MNKENICDYCYFSLGTGDCLQYCNNGNRFLPDKIKLSHEALNIFSGILRTINVKIEGLNFTFFNSINYIYIEITYDLKKPNDKYSIRINPKIIKKISPEDFGKMIIRKLYGTDRTHEKKQMIDNFIIWINEVEKKLKRIDVFFKFTENSIKI